MAERTAEEILFGPPGRPARQLTAEEILFGPQQVSLAQGMADEALRLIALPFRTFSEEAVGGAEQMGQGINAALAGEPGSAAWNLGVGGLRAVGAPITAATRLITDPASRLIQSATGISEPTREMIQTGGDILGGAALPVGIGAVRGVMAAPGAVAGAARTSSGPVSVSAVKLAPPSPPSALSRPVQEGLSEARMAEPLFGEITGSAAEAVRPLVMADPTTRLFRHVAAALENGTLAPDGVMQVMRKY